jgi:hypothetical protein
MSYSQSQGKTFLQSSWRRTAVLFLGLTIAVAGSAALAAQDEFKPKPAAQSTGDKSIEDKLKEVERERDDLKRRNAELEQRLKQLQATVDDQVHQALGEGGEGVRAYAFPPPAGAFGRRGPRPFVSQYRPMFPSFGALPDPVELAIAFSDALGEKGVAKPALDAAKQRVELGRGGSTTDVDAASARLSAADRKVRLLRGIVTTARAVAAEDVERLRKLGAVHAVAAVDVRNAEAKLKILDDILAMDPESTSKPAIAPAAGEPK